MSGERLRPRLAHLATSPSCSGVIPVWSQAMPGLLIPYNSGSPPFQACKRRGLATMREAAFLHGRSCRRWCEIACWCGPGVVSRCCLSGQDRSLPTILRPAQAGRRLSTEPAAGKRSSVRPGRRPIRTGSRFPCVCFPVRAGMLVPESGGRCAGPWAAKSATRIGGHRGEAPPLLSKRSTNPLRAGPVCASRGGVARGACCSPTSARP